MIVWNEDELLELRMALNDRIESVYSKINNLKYKYENYGDDSLGLKSYTPHVIETYQKRLNRLYKTREKLQIFCQEELKNVQEIN